MGRKTANKLNETMRRLTRYKVTPSKVCPKYEADLNEEIFQEILEKGVTKVFARWGKPIVEYGAIQPITFDVSFDDIVRDMDGKKICFHEWYCFENKKRGVAESGHHAMFAFWGGSSCMMIRSYFHGLIFNYLASNELAFRESQKCVVGTLPQSLGQGTHVAQHHTPKQT